MSPHAPEGVWKAFYFTGEESDPEQTAIVVLQNGKLMGRDPWGMEYSGTYTFGGRTLNLEIDVDEYNTESAPIIPVTPPFKLKLTSQMDEPNRFNAAGEVVDTELTISLICKRIF